MDNPAPTAQALRRTRGWGATLLPLALLGGCPAGTEEGAPMRELRFVGPIHEPADLSAVEILDRYLVIGSDEGERVQLLEPLDDDRTYRVRGEGLRLVGVEQEVDIEGLARQGEVLFVLGSHARKRLLLKSEASYRDNRARLFEVAPEPFRRGLFRVRLDPETGEPVSEVESIDLQTILERDPLLAPFTRIPDKENGLSFEGLAVDAERLWIGCRSPVLREGFVPVLVLPYDRPETYELRFVQLEGRGIRAMARVRGGFLLIAVDERVSGPAVVYRWDGEDGIPGTDRPAGRVQALARLPASPDAVPEGLAVLDEDESGYDVVVVHDGPLNGRPTRLRIPLRPSLRGSE